MALIRMKQIRAMSDAERISKLNELKMELIKGSVTANRATAKTKEIKRAISRIISVNNSSRKGKEELKNK